MDCTDFRASLSGFVDGELDATLRHHAERHLVECTPCRDRVARAEALDLLLRDAATRWGREDALPAAVVDSVMIRTVADVKALRSARRAAYVGWLAAAAAVGLAAIAWLSGERQPMSISTVTDGLDRTRTEIATRPPARPDRVAPRRILPRSPDPRELPASSSMLANATVDPMPERPVQPSAPASVSVAVSGPPAWLNLPDARDGTIADIPQATLDHLHDSDVRLDRLQDGIDALFATALLLRQLRMEESMTFVSEGDIPDRIEYDRLVDRLDALDSMLGDPECSRALQAAAAMLLRLQHGANRVDELNEMHRHLGRLALPECLEHLAERLEGSTQA